MNLFSNFNKFGKKKALVFKDTEISYSELEGFTIKNNVFDKDSLVLLINDNSIESIMFYVLIMKSKNISLMLIENNTNEKSILEILENYQHDYLILPKKKYKYFYNTFFSILEIGSYLVLKNKKLITKNINTDNKLMLTTSGSLGSSKFVRLSLNNLKFNSKQIIEYLKIEKKDKIITTMPMSYSYMLSIINTHLESGASIYINHSSIFQREFWNYFDKK